MNQTKLAKALKVSHSAIQKSATGHKFMEITTLIKASDILGVGLDWLLKGVGTYPGIMNTKADPKFLQELGLRFEMAIKNSGKSQALFAREIGIPVNIIEEIILGQACLDYYTMAKAAKKLHVKLDWLAWGDGPAPTADAGELAILDELDAAGMKYNKQQLDYIFQLVTRLEQESQEEFYELIIHSAKSTLRAIVNRKTKEYTVTEEPNTPDADVSS